MKSHPVDKGFNEGVSYRKEFPSASVTRDDVSTRNVNDSVVCIEMQL